MGQRLSPQDEELYRRVDEVLHYLWDPIGVAGTPEARDEYYGYLPHVFALLKTSTDGDDIAEYLLSIEKDRMELKVDSSSRQRVSRAVETLLRYRELANKG